MPLFCKLDNKAANTTGLMFLIQEELRDRTNEFVSKGCRITYLKSYAVIRGFWLWLLLWLQYFQKLSLSNSPLIDLNDLHLIFDISSFNLIFTSSNLFL